MVEGRNIRLRDKRKTFRKGTFSSTNDAILVMHLYRHTATFKQDCPEQCKTEDKLTQLCFHFCVGSLKYMQRF